MHGAQQHHELGAVGLRDAGWIETDSLRRECPALVTERQSSPTSSSACIPERAASREKSPSRCVVWACSPLQQEGEACQKCPGTNHVAGTIRAPWGG